MSYESIRKLFTKWIVSFAYNEYLNCEIETYKKYCRLTSTAARNLGYGCCRVCALLQ